MPLPSARFIELTPAEMARASHFPTPSTVLAVGPLGHDLQPARLGTPLQAQAHVGVPGGFGHRVEQLQQVQIFSGLPTHGNSRPPAKKRAAGPKPAARRRFTAQTDDVEGVIAGGEGFVSPLDSGPDFRRNRHLAACKILSPSPA